MKSVKNRSICFSTVSHPMYALGGAEIMTYQYAVEFAKRGWRVFFLTKSGKIITDKFDNDSIRIVTYPKKNYAIYYLILFRLIIKERIDVFFFRNNTYTLGIIALFQALMGYLLVWSIKHDDKCGVHAATAELRAKNAHSTSHMLKLKYNLMDSIFQYGVKNAQLILAQNKAQKKIISEGFGGTSIINYSSTYIPEYNPIRENMVLFIATMKDFKRPHLFCEIAGHFSEHQYRFVMIGKNFNDTTNSEFLMKEAKRNNVEYIGQLELEEVKQYLDKSRLLINTSSAEGFPNTFVHAISHGVPVITLGVDPDNIIEKNELGYVCNNGIKEMTQKVNYLLDNEDIWKKYSTNCYRYAKENLDIVKSVDNLQNLF